MGRAAVAAHKRNVYVGGMQTNPPSTGKILPTLQIADPGMRALLLMAVAIAYPVWDIGFELGLHGRVYVEKLFAAWSISTVILLVLLFMPRKAHAPPLVWFATASPSVWLLLALSLRTAPEELLLRYIVLGAGLLTYIACLPYALFAAVSLSYPEILSSKSSDSARLKYVLVAIILILGATGFGIGSNHNRILVCEDFEISGQYVPADCNPDKPRPPAGEN